MIEFNIMNLTVYYSFLTISFNPYWKLPFENYFQIFHANPIAGKSILVISEINVIFSPILRNDPLLPLLLDVSFVGDFAKSPLWQI